MELKVGMGVGDGPTRFETGGWTRLPEFNFFGKIFQSFTRDSTTKDLKNLTLIESDAQNYFNRKIC